MNYLIYDSISSGHHSEYISHLVNYILGTQNDNVFFFVVSIEIKEKNPEIVAKTNNNTQICWDWIPKLETNKLSSYSLIKRSFVELKLVEDYANKLKAKEVYLMYFNVFQLALIFKRPKFIIKGILFLQFLRMPKDTLKDKLKYCRKFWITKLYSKNSSIANVFILNDDSTVSQLNKTFCTNIFKMLPDPIPNYKKEIGFDVHKEYNISKGKKILLHPGAIDPRKGTYEIIEAIDFLSDKETDEFAILIIGRAKSEIEIEIINKIQALKNKNFTIIFKNSFVANERLKSLFLQSEAVLMPYKNSEASSGILGHAVITNKCIIAPNTGLIGDIVCQNNFGVLIDEVNAKSVANAIKQVSSFELDANNAIAFANKHTDKIFSSLLLNN